MGLPFNTTTVERRAESQGALSTLSEHMSENVSTTMRPIRRL